MAHSFNRLDDTIAVRNFQDIASGGVPMIMPPTNPMVGFFGAILSAYFFVINVLSIPFRLLMRKNMGERAFSVFTYISSVLCFTILISGLAYLGYASWIGFVFTLPEINSEMFLNRLLFTTLVILINPYFIFLVIFLEKGRIHFGRVLNRAKSKEYIYSFYQGEGIYFEHKKKKKFLGFQVNDIFVRMIYEPIGMLKFSIPILIINYILINKSDVIIEDSFYLNFVNTFIAGLLLTAIVLSLGAICTLLLEFGALQKERGAALDMIDGEVDMQRILSLKDNFVLKELSVNRESTTNSDKNKSSDSIGIAIID